MLEKYKELKMNSGTQFDFDTINVVTIPNDYIAFIRKYKGKSKTTEMLKGWKDWKYGKVKKYTRKLEFGEVLIWVIFIG